MRDPALTLITGANRGIGLEIARQLSRKGHRVLLGSRDRAKGSAAVEALKAQGLDAAAVPLDVTGPVEEQVGDIERAHGPIDVLINNAGILIDGPGGFSSRALDLEIRVLRATFQTNLEGPLRLIQAVLPGMRTRRHGRVVNVSSTAGQMAGMSSGFPAYRLSKVALNALTVMIAAEVDEPDVKIDAMCPGWVRTDMGGPEAQRSVAEGADTAVWLAELPSNGPTGGFFQDRAPIAW